MIMVIIAAAGALIWAAFVFFAYRQITGGVRTGREHQLDFHLKAAPWSDRHVKSLLAGNPRSPVLLRQYVANAADRKEWAEALRRAELFTSRAPRQPEAWLSRIDVLRRAGRDEEAVALLQKTASRMPTDYWVLIASARDAIRRKDWDEAERRFAGARRRFPDRVEVYREAAEALIEQGRAADATAMLAAGLRRLPEASPLWHSFARLAERTGDTEEALRRWEDVRRRFPDEPAGFRESVEALRKAGRAGEAAALLRQARDIFPADKSIRALAERLVPAAETPLPS